VASVDWTHPSVKALLQESGADDPYSAMEDRARELTLRALEEGWTGPPYDPFYLADVLGIETVARQDLEDARLVPVEGGEPRIEFNPNRRPARIRFSVAHELGHFLLSDFAEQVRYRDRSHGEPGGADDWQLESVCNVAAAELLMPAGAFPLADTRDLSLPHLLDLRQPFGVSTEALLRRVVKLTGQPTCLFAAARAHEDDRFRIDYTVGSRSWSDGLRAGDLLPGTSVLGRCTAVGFSDAAVERWGDQDVDVQAVGIPPYPGDRFPRVVGLLRPATQAAVPTDGLRYVRGNATQPRGDGARIIAHVVNDQAQRWGGRGFAMALADRYPEAKDSYAERSPDERALGSVHISEAEPELWIASLVAQKGYGESERPRLRLSALSTTLRALANEAIELEATVHLPPIGSGQGGMPWPPIRDLILEEVVDRGVSVTVYVLEDEPMPDDAEVPAQLTLA
jgi:O-acetyl-ADP-ribose deacetylase (regulator of RNase III)